MSLVYFVVLPLLVAFLTPFYKNHLKAVGVISSSLLLFLAYHFWAKVPLEEFIAFDSPLAISFMLHSGSAFFVFLFIFVMLLLYLFQKKEEITKEVFILSHLFLAGVLGLILSHDIFNIYIFFELASISAYIFTALKRDKIGYGGALKYMIVGSLASLFLLLAIMLIYLNLGVLSLEEIAKNFHLLDTKVKFLILLSLFVGFGIKAEILPLNFWVADIYQASGSKVNALFSAILSKAYIFVFFNILFLLQVQAKYLSFLVVVGILSFIIAEMSAFGAKNIKRVFAYSSLGQIGIVFMAFATADLLVVSGAFFLIFVHSLAKLMIFLALDILEGQFKNQRRELFGMFSSAFLFFIFAVGFLSLIGIPPFGGFMAKLTILKGLVGLEHYLIIGVILLFSLVEATYFFRLLGFYTNQNSSKEAVQIPLCKKVVLGGLALILLFAGLFAESILGIFQSAAAAILGGFHV